jgi:hypothetical protein
MYGNVEFTGELGDLCPIVLLLIFPSWQPTPTRAICPSDSRITHQQASGLLPITRFQASELASTIEEMNLALRSEKLKFVP